MLWLSEILIQNPTLESFDQLIEKVHDGARQGERFFRMDIKPPYRDTPEDWELQLESAFNGVIK
ncbi:MAG TPA: sulfur relay protein DsrC [Chromatiaceae bacterium]|jgi:hypothetical protein|nr:sulfur relay protein DsrC [Chromatiaceae bacterium]HIN81335.1 sulfur relay protein DsrC [Chromatiales bacterium]HIA08014.1 sulfur relay protein DsrC [Chromatiaceae bacterium]HIB84856.1 sulfur relay protein DsrC [Chromatiaceae bacterium]HIO13930.1 sulfur relay protein DsrC [Chromatiales bacterium]